MGTKVYSASGTIGTTLNITSVDPNFNQLFVTANYYSDANLETPVTPGAGTIAIQGRPNGAGGFSNLSMSPLDCTDTGDFGSSSVPLDALRFTPIGVTTATHYQITVTARAD